MTTARFASRAYRLLRASSVSVALSGLLAVGCNPNNWSDQPETSSVGVIPSLGGDYVTLTNDPNVSGTFAITSSTLFWVDRGNITDTVQALSLEDGSPLQLYAASPDPTAAIEDLAVDETNVYVTQLALNGSSFTSQVVAIPQDGGAPTILASGSDSFVDLSVAGAYVYYSNGDTLFRVPITGGKSETVDGSGTEGILDPTLGSLSTSGGAVYWTELGGIGEENMGTSLMTLAKPDAKPTKLTEFSAAGAPLLATNSSSLFWVATSANSVSFVVAAPAGGDETSIVTSTSDSIVGLLADESNVYTLVLSAEDQTESLIETPIGGGDPATLVTGLQPPSQGDARHALAQDADGNIYLAQSGAVLSVTK
jgi:hypothetical protein